MTARFIFICCQHGAEAAVKSELQKSEPQLRFAFSRPGFLTFKSTEPEVSVDVFKRLVFARTYGTSIGSIGDSTEQLQNELAQLPPHPFKHLHVWHRDTRVPGDQFEPSYPRELDPTGPAARILAGVPELQTLQFNRVARIGEWVIDLLQIDESSFWLGYHQATTVSSCWVGGMPPIQLRDDVISRAYWKMEESLRWSRLPIQAGDRCIEIGSSPGGSCQSLLERGLLVTGIDPAKMHPALLEHPNFVHIQARADDLKRREFSGTPWLFGDANIAPTNTLDAVEQIVTNRRVNTHGMLLTLKLLDWSMANDLESYLQRIAGWGYRYIRARQLSFNRKEVCVCALKRKSILRRPHPKPRRRPMKIPAPEIFHSDGPRPR